MLQDGFRIKIIVLCLQVLPPVLEVYGLVRIFIKVHEVRSGVLARALEGSSA
jgi:hypothetical protein